MSKIQAGSLVIEPDRFQACVNDEPLSLKPRVFDALVLFARSPGKVLSKQDLMDALWADTYVTESSLFKVIQELRQALARGGCTDVSIVTIQARGYRMEVGAAEQTVAARLPAPGTRARRVASSILVLTAVALVGIGWWQYTDQDGESAVAADREALRARIEALAVDAPSDALAALESHAWPAQEWWVQYQSGLALQRLGRMDEALEQMQAANRHDDLTEPQRTRTLKALVGMLRTIGRPGDAVALVRDEIDNAGSIDPSLALAVGNAQLEAGRTDEASQLFEFAAAEAERQQLPALRYQALSNLGNVAYQRGDSDAANEYYENALNLALATGDTTIAAGLQNNLANIAQERAQYQTAARYYAQAYRLMKGKIKAEQSGYIVLNFANTHLEAGKYDVADYYYEQLIGWAAERRFHEIRVVAAINAGFSPIPAGAIRPVDESFSGPDRDCSDGWHSRFARAGAREHGACDGGRWGCVGRRRGSPGRAGSGAEYPARRRAHVCAPGRRAGASRHGSIRPGFCRVGRGADADGIPR